MPRIRTECRHFLLDVVVLPQPCPQSSCPLLCWGTCRAQALPHRSPCATWVQAHVCRAGVNDAGAVGFRNSKHQCLRSQWLPGKVCLTFEKWVFIISRFHRRHVGTGRVSVKMVRKAEWIQAKKLLVMFSSIYAVNRFLSNLSNSCDDNIYSVTVCSLCYILWIIQLLFQEICYSSNLKTCLHFVTGPPGTGKTSLCKALAQKLTIRLSSR